MSIRKWLKNKIIFKKSGYLIVQCSYNIEKEEEKKAELSKRWNPL